MIHILKFVAIWLAAAALSAGALYALSGTPSSLDPQIEAGRAKECENLSGAFTQDSAEECLAQVARLVERTALSARGSLLQWHALCALLTLIAGSIFMIKVVSRDRVAGTLSEFRSLRSDWFVYLGVIVAVCIIGGVLAHGSFFDRWAGTLNVARGWGIPAFMTIVWAATYWIGTRVATPDKMQPSIPGS